jgi:hypothetical protein
MGEERTSDDEWVLMPVQRRYLSIVNNAIHEAWVEDAASTSTSTPGAARRGWTRPEIDRLKLEITNPTVRALLDLTADRPNGWVTYDELCMKAGRDWAEVRGDLAGFSVLLRRQFNRQGRDSWPVEVEWATSETPTRYRMPPNLARWWNDAQSRPLPQGSRI